MAFYEMLPGAGMPPGLQAGMDSVLNKKFGTSTTYPAEDWPDTVNLMGPLPEKTASGAIVTFADGADAVPLKKCEVTLPASLDGYSSVNVVATGKNLVDGTNFTRGLPSTTIGASIETISASTRYAYFGTPIKGGNYTVSSVSNDTDYYNAILIFGYSNGYLSVYTGGTVNGSKTVDLSACDYVRIASGTRTAQITVPTNFTDYGTIQLEAGSTATTYEPYTAPTTHTAQLGRTIYGGTPDIVNGTGKGTHKGYTLDNLTWSLGSISGISVWYVDLSADGLKLPTNSAIFSGICDNYTPIRFNAVKDNTNAIALRDNGRLYVNNGSDTTQPTGKVTIELATPTDFTFTPITPTPETALGTNNFWADEGDSEVTYRADINLALGGN